MQLAKPKSKGRQYKIGIEAPESMLIMRDEDNYKNSPKYKRQLLQKNKKRTSLPTFQKPKNYQTKDKKFNIDAWLNDNIHPSKFSEVL